MRSTAFNRAAPHHCQARPADYPPRVRATIGGYRPANEHSHTSISVSTKLRFRSDNGRPVGWNRRKEHNSSRSRGVCHFRRLISPARSMRHSRLEATGRVKKTATNVSSSNTMQSAMTARIKLIEDCIESGFALVSDLHQFPPLDPQQLVGMFCFIPMMGGKQDGSPVRFGPNILDHACFAREPRWPFAQKAEMLCLECPWLAIGV
jgi:hypothetical protein